MFIIYDLIFFIVAIIHLPVYLFRRKFHRGFLARVGFLPRGLKLVQPVWIHAVSVGEVMAIRKLLEELTKVYPGKQIVISTVTPTGNKVARSIAREIDFVTYLPLDISFIVKKVIDSINPSLFIIAETEIWPNLISYLSKKNTPLLVVNGRISNSSFRGYAAIKFFLTPILNKIKFFCVQTKRDAQRLRHLGVNEERICITGNMKFDSSICNVGNSELLKYRKGLSLESSDRLLVCGSTHAGEEEILIDVYRQLLGDFHNLKLLIAPRHPERGREVAALISKAGFCSVLISRPKNHSALRDNPIFILDTVGELRYYYAIAEIVFVGGSLVKKGGQNILEPACLEKPVIFGPHMFNFQDIAELFLGDDTALSVNSKQELKIRIKELLVNPHLAQQMGKKAKQLILDNAGSTQKNLELIKANFNRAVA